METSYPNRNTTPPKRESKFYVRNNATKGSDRPTGPITSTPVPGSMRIDGNEPVYGFLPSSRLPVIPQGSAPVHGDEFEQYLSDIAIISEVPFLA